MKFILAYALSTSGQAKQIFTIKRGRPLWLKNQGMGGREVEIRERVFKVGLGVNDKLPAPLNVRAAYH